MSRKVSVSRRDFLKTSGVAGAGILAAANYSRALGKSPNERLGVACIGIGGKGTSDSNNAAKFGNIVAICDIDKKRLFTKKQESGFTNVATYTDYREMLEKHRDAIDIVVISTPDHGHLRQTLLAMEMGKHVYTQKPLTRSLAECRMLGEMAKKTGVCTQMGNQGASMDSSRRVIGELRKWVLGKVTEIFAWSDRPVWPQGLRNGMSPINTLARFAESVASRDDAEALIANKRKEIAEGLENADWEKWLEKAPAREFYPKVYHPFNWRGWWDFGGGAMADMGCHLSFVPYFGCNLGQATSAQAKTTGHNRDIFPSSSIVRLDFPANESHDGITYWWYDRKGNKPPIDIDAYKMRNEKGKLITELSEVGVFIRGEKGAALSSDDYCATFAYSEGITPPTDIEMANPDMLGVGIKECDAKHMEELFMAVREGKPEICTSRFERAVALTEQILLGNLAVAAAPNGSENGTLGEWGERIEWDPATQTITNLASLQTPELAELVKPAYL